MTYADNVVPQDLKLPRAETGLFLRGLVGSAVLLLAIKASESLFFGAGYFSSLTYHPFWIVILLAAVQHGLFVGLSIVGLATMMMDWPSRAVGTDITEYYVDIATQPVQWLVVALVIGLYRQQQLGRERALAQEAERLRNVNLTLAGEIHRLDAFVARTELAAATRAFETALPHAASGADILEALDRLSRADASHRPMAFIEAARTCLSTPVVWLHLDKNQNLSPVIATHDNIQMPNRTPAHILTSAIMTSASDQPLRFAPGEGPAPAGYNAICRTVFSQVGRPIGAILALTPSERGMEDAEPALAALCCAIESSLRRSPPSRAPSMIYLAPPREEPAHAHA